MSIPVHGNYHGYYAKRPGVLDERLKLFPRSLFCGKRVLDIGCNDGKVSCEIAQIWGAQMVVGVDIDDVLVESAWKRRRAAWSRQAPACAEGPSTNETKTPDEEVMPTEDLGQSPLVVATASYFPASFQHELGALPIPPLAKRDRTTFPHNLVFRKADWVNEEIPDDAEGYDVVLGFSISKWIHLNGGDEGLKRFFKKVFSVLKPGGRFILEPQGWESYAKARRMDPKLQENSKGLQLRPNDFPAVLHAVGFAHTQDVGTTGSGGLERPLLMFEKPPTSEKT